MTEAHINWTEVAVTTLGVFDGSHADRLVGNMGIIAAGIASPLREDWQQQANDGVAWARNGGLVERIGHIWSLTDAGREEFLRVLDEQQADA